MLSQPSLSTVREKGEDEDEDEDEEAGGCLVVLDKASWPSRAAALLDTWRLNALPEVPPDEEADPVEPAAAAAAAVAAAATACSLSACLAALGSMARPRSANTSPSTALGSVATSK